MEIQYYRTIGPWPEASGSEVSGPEALGPEPSGAGASGHEAPSLEASGSEVSYERNDLTEDWMNISD